VFLWYCFWKKIFLCRYFVRMPYICVHSRMHFDSKHNSLKNVWIKKKQMLCNHLLPIKNLPSIQYLHCLQHLVNILKITNGFEIAIWKGHGLWAKSATVLPLADPCYTAEVGILWGN
jgi:hypothetical protein